MIAQFLTAVFFMAVGAMTMFILIKVGVVK